jgi:hypothetical protein
MAEQLPAQIWPLHASPWRSSRQSEGGRLLLIHGCAGREEMRGRPDLGVAPRLAGTVLCRGGVGDHRCRERGRMACSRSRPPSRQGVRRHGASPPRLAAAHEVCRAEPHRAAASFSRGSAASSASPPTRWEGGAEGKEERRERGRGTAGGGVKK